MERRSESRRRRQARPAELQHAAQTPLYQQVASVLTREILTGQVGSGVAIGTEPELMRRFSVSRVTLRHALDLLVDDGLIVRRQGKGTFVRDRSLDIPLGPLAGTTQLARGAGHVLGSRVHDLAQIVGPPDVRRTLGVPEGERLVRFWRVDSEDERPIAAALIYLPASVGGTLTRRDLETEALYPLLAERTGVVAESAQQTIEAAAAEGKAARLLLVSDGAPVAVVQRLTRDQSGRPFEHLRVYFTAGSARFTVSLRRGPDADLSLPVDFQVSHNNA